MKFWIPTVIMALLVGCSVVPTHLPGNSLTNGNTYALERARFAFRPGWVLEDPKTR